MDVNQTAERQPAGRELSLVVPCYNEEKCLESTMPPLARAFQEAGVDIELVLVDNGSTDRTSEVIDKLMAEGWPILKLTVPVNRGQGLGFLTGYRAARGKYVGHICADGQVAPESVVEVYSALRAVKGPALAKARRRFRQDSYVRKVVSIGYNALMLVLFPGIGSIDVNGNPKFMPAESMRLMDLSSMDWFLEAEITLKARHLRLKIVELDVPGFPRQAGKSNVRLATILEFVGNIVAYRFGSSWRDWRKQVTQSVA